MYTVTFYSYRGGVGRTTALVNVAVDLALRGRKVLVVDFDLEAPSVPGFGPLQPEDTSPGLVEFVAEYLHSGKAPDIEGYVYQAKPVGKECGDIWVMPAGNIGLKGYWQTFQEINWKELYELRDGFLLFEDLKFQWREALRPDYVLIDARAGINDRLAICTRQLPDAVVMMCVPDRGYRQETGSEFARDLDGFCHVEEDIESDRRRIDILAVGSKVPDLDGEQLRLEEMIMYNDGDYPLVATIPHAPELLPERQVNSNPRPRKRLAQAYRRLANAIIRSNCTGDPEGARAFLKELQQHPDRAVAAPRVDRAAQLDQVITNVSYEAYWVEEGLHRAATQLDQVIAKFNNNAEILAQAASCLFLAERRGRAMEILDQAVELAPSSDEIRWQRASYRRLIKHPDAVDDLLRLLETPGADLSAHGQRTQLKEMMILPEIEPELKAPELDTTPVDTADQLTADFPGIDAYVASAFQQLRRLHPNKLEEALQKPRIQQLSPEAREALIADAPILSPCAEPDLRPLIQARKWLAAITHLEARVAKPSSTKPADLFYLAMAQWGSGNEAQAEKRCREATASFLKEKPLELILQEFGAFARLQDLPLWSLAFWKAGFGTAAKQLLDRCEERLVEEADDRDFYSIWRFRPVHRVQFEEDCHEQRKMIQGVAIRPPFLGKEPGRVER